MNNYEHISTHMVKHQYIRTNINNREYIAATWPRPGQRIWPTINKWPTNMNRGQGHELEQRSTVHEQISPLPSCWIRTMWKLCEKHHMAAQICQPSDAKNRNQSNIKSKSMNDHNDTIQYIRVCVQKCNYCNGPTIGPINKYEQISTNMNKYQQIWITMNNYQQMWINVDRYEQMSTNMNKHKQIWTNMWIHILTNMNNYQ